MRVFADLHRAGPDRGDGHPRAGHRGARRAGGDPPRRPAWRATSSTSRRRPEPMPIWEAVTMALRTIWAQKLKSFFSLIGVLIGVTFLIAVVSIVQGMNVYMEDQFANRLIGLNTFQLRRGPTSTRATSAGETWRELAPPSPHHLRRRGLRQGAGRRPRSPSRMFCSGPDGAQLQRQARQGHQPGRDRRRPTSRSRTTSSSTAGASRRRKSAPARTVVVLGDLVAEKLFPGVDPVGKDVIIAGLPYRIIGVVAKQGTLFGLSHGQVRRHALHRAGPALHLPDQHPRRPAGPDGRPHRDAGRAWTRSRR